MYHGSVSVDNHFKSWVGKKGGYVNNSVSIDRKPTRINKKGQGPLLTLQITRFKLKSKVRNIPF